MKFKKLKDLAKGARAVTAVPLKLANLPLEAAQPGQPTPAAHALVGVRVLTVGETEEVYKKACARAKADGVPEWKDDHPLCKLALMVHTLAVACVDNETPDGKDPEPFFESIEEILDSRELGPDNIVYLYERWEDWQDACSIETKNLGPEEVIAIALVDAEGDGKESPLVRMRPGLRVSYTHTLAVLLSNLLRAKSHAGAPAESASNSTPKSTESESSSNPPGPATGIAEG